MNELVNQIVKKTGISAAMATTIVNIVVGFLKKKLPAPIANQIDLVLKNDAQVAAAEKVVGNLLGSIKKKK